MTSPYLARPLRSETEAREEMDRDDGRSGGWPETDIAIGHLQCALQEIEAVARELVAAHRRLPIGDGMDDEIKGLADLASDITGKMERLRR